MSFGGLQGDLAEKGLGTADKILFRLSFGTFLTCFTYSLISILVVFAAATTWYLRVVPEPSLSESASSSSLSSTELCPSVKAKSLRVLERAQGGGSSEMLARHQ